MRALLSHTTLLRDPALRPGPGVPLCLELRLVEARVPCRPIVNAVVALWHHDWRGVPTPNGLQSIPQGSEQLMVSMQLSDSQGQVTLNTICPGALADGRTRLHLRVFLNDAVSVTAIASTDLMLPADVTQRVQRHPPYRPVRPRLAGLEPSAAGPENTSHELRNVHGHPDHGFRGELTLAIAC